VIEDDLDNLLEDVAVLLPESQDGAAESDAAVD